MTQNMTQLIFFICLGIIAIYVISDMLVKIVKVVESKKTKPPIILDKDTTKIYFNQLDQIIQYETIYFVDSKTGDSMSQNKGLSADLGNDEIYELYTEISKTVIDKMGDKMKTYLYDNFGSAWIHEYIKIYAMSMLINYTKLSIEQIALAK